MLSPASTVAASAVLVTVRSGQLTVISTAPEELLAVLASLEAAVVAVLLTVPQVSEVVGELICTVLLPVAITVPKLQLSVPPAIEHAAASAPPLMVQLRPPLEGSRSVRVTSCPSPGPALLTVMVYPMVSPASTVVASAVLLT